MALKGDLKDINLADIFQTLSMNQQEGTLTVISGTKRMDLYFSKEGIHLLTTTDKKYPRLGEILLKEKKITPVELDMALARQKMTGELIGQALIDMGIVSTADIEQSVRRQIEEEIYDVFSWKNARFEFIPGEPKGEFFDPARLGKPITFDVSGIIMEAARRVDEWEQIHRVVPSMQAVLKVQDPNADIPLLDEVGVAEEAVRKIAELIDGKRTVEKIVEESPASKFDTSKVLASLVQKRYAEVLGIKEMILVADSYANEGDVKTAIKIYKETLKDLPPSSIFKQRLAQLYESIGDQKEAALEYATLADALFEEGSDEDALSLYQKALELAPKNFRLHHKLFEFYFKKGMNEDAVKEGLFVARSYWRINKLQEARETLGKLIEIAPDNLEVRQMLINISLDLEDTDEAVKHYEYLAECYSKTRDRSSLIEIYRKILSIDKSRSDIKAKLDRELGRIAKVEKKKEVGHKPLIISFTILLIVAGAAIAFWYYNHLADTDMERIKDAILNFSKQQVSEVPTEDADRLKRDFEGLKRKFERLRSRYKYAFFTDYEEWRRECESLLGRCEGIVKDICERREEEIRQAQQEIATLLEKAEKLDGGGDKSGALGIYKRILERAKTDPCSVESSLKVIVQQRVTELKQYLANARFLYEEATAAEKDGAYRKAFHKMKEILKDYPHSPEAKKLMLPLIIETVPEGAAVWINGVKQKRKTPVVVKRKPNTVVKVMLRRYGYNDVTLSVTDEQLKIHKELQKVPVWKTELKGVMVISPVTTDGKRIYIVNVSGSITALDVAEGRVSWKYKPEEFGHFKSNAVLVDGYVVIGSLNNMFYVIEKEEGRSYWKSRIPGPVTQPVLRVGENVLVTVENPYGTSGESLVLKLNIEERQKKEFKKFPQKVRSSLLLDERERVILVCAGRTVTALDTDGREVWSHTISQQISGEMAIVKDFIVLPTNRGSLLRLRRERNLPTPSQEEEEGGQISRELSPVMLGSLLTTGVCSVDKLVFVCTYTETTKESFVHAVDITTGREVWRSRIEKRVDSTPITDGKAIFVVDSAGKVYAYKVDTGELLWQDSVDDEVVATPTIVGELLIVVTKGGSKPSMVYAYVR